MAIRHKNRTTWTELQRVFCCWIYFHISSKIFSGLLTGGDRPYRPLWSRHCPVLTNLDRAVPVPKAWTKRHTNLPLLCLKLRSAKGDRCLLFITFTSNRRILTRENVRESCITAADAAAAVRTNGPAGRLASAQRTQLMINSTHSLGAGAGRPAAGDPSNFIVWCQPWLPGWSVHAASWVVVFYHADTQTCEPTNAHTVLSAVRLNCVKSECW